MANARKPYARYFIVRDLATMWRDDPAKPGSPFREFVITSNEFISTQGTFQVFGLEGTSGGIKNGKFAASDEEPKILFDKDFNGLDSAAKQFDQLITEAQRGGFHHMKTMDVLEFEDKIRRSQQGL